MPKMILEFHEICCPVQNNEIEGDGHDWVCYHGTSWLFNDANKHLGNLGNLLEVDDHTDFFFDCEVDAHFAASAYYISHNRKYPYMEEFTLALNAQTPEFDSEDVGSRTMEFI